MPTPAQSVVTGTSTAGANIRAGSPDTFLLQGNAAATIKPDNSPAPVSTASPDKSEWREIVGPSGFSIRQFATPLSLASGGLSFLNERAAFLRDAGRNCPQTGDASCEVFEIADIPHTWLCLFGSTLYMNVAMNRMSAYIEEPGHPLLTHRRHLLNPDNDRFAGHDLRGKDMADFLQVLSRRQASWKVPEEASRLHRIETEFRNALLAPLLTHDGEAILITSNVNENWKVTASHELSHAQFFAQPDFRKAVLDYWATNVSPEERARLAEAWGDIYDPANEELQANELMAYNLQTKRNRYFPDQSHRAPLKERIEAAGARSIAIDVFAKGESGISRPG